MEQEEISLTEFRKSLGRYCKPVNRGKKELTVTYRNVPFFVVKRLSLSGNHAPEIGFTDVRDRMKYFVDLIKQNEMVILTFQNEQLVRCVKC